MRRFHETYDLLLTPTLPLAAFEAGQERPDPVHQPRWINWAPFSNPFNLTQQPAASVPCGLSTAGLPVGLQIVGPMHADALVLRAARSFEASASLAAAGDATHLCGRVIDPRHRNPLPGDIARAQQADDLSAPHPAPTDRGLHTGKDHLAVPLGRVSYAQNDMGTVQCLGRPCELRSGERSGAKPDCADRRARIRTLSPGRPFPMSRAAAGDERFDR